MTEEAHRDQPLPRVLTAPMRGQQPGRLVGLPWLIAALLTVAQIAWAWFVQRPRPFEESDVPHYVRIAQGDTAHVLLPFASRQLGPLLAAAASHLFGWSIQSSFVVEGYIYFAIALVMMWLLNVRSGAPRWMLAAVFFLPYWEFLLQSLAYPDMIYAALIGLMLWALSNEQVMLAALLLFPMMLARESTSLTLVCFLIAVWPKSGWKERITAVAATVAGGAIVSHMTRVNAGNIEKLPGFLYLLAKVPWNLMRNVLGIIPWSPVYSRFCSAPVWQMHVPYQRVGAVGVCGIDHVAQMALLRDLLTGFGLLPLLAAVLWWQQRKTKGRSVLLRFVLVYGWLAFLLAPVLGAWFLHIAGYAWPLFALGCSLLLGERGTTLPETGKHAWAGLVFLVLHLVTCLFYFIRIGVDPAWLGLPMWVVGSVVLWLWLAKPAQAAVSR